jgi:uncharacterized membrane protein YdjX (TVP38/TMEM64 family)
VAAGDGHEADGRRARPLLRFVPLALLVAGMAVVFATGAPRFLKLEKLDAHRDWLQSFVEANAAEALLLYMVIYVAVVALSVPGALFLTVFGGFLFGGLTAGAATVAAATLGAVIVFLIARTSFGDMLARKAGPRLERIMCGFRADAFAYLLFLRLVPIFPFWLVNLAPALVGVPLRTFALATLAGIVPGTFAFAFAGEGLDSVIAAHKAAKEACLAAGGADCYMKISPRALVTPKLLIALAALGVVALIPVVVRRWYGRRADAVDAGSRGA